LNAAESSGSAVKGKEVIGRGTVGTAAGLDGDGVAINVDNGTAGTSSRGGGVGLVVACVEIAVTFLVFGGVSVETTNNT